MKTQILFYVIVIVSFGLVTTSSCNTDDDCIEQNWYQDSDGDGFGNSTKVQSSCSQPAGFVHDNTDCEDTDADINPNATENSTDGIDNNCDGEIDECISNSDCDDGDASTYDVCENGVCKYYVLCTNYSDCPAGMSCVDIGGGIFICQ